MQPDQLIYFVVLALVAEILGTVGGFGSSLFFVPIATYFLGFHSALGVTALFHVSSNISKIALFRKGFDKRLIITIGIPSVIFVTVGALLSNFAKMVWLEIALAIFLITLSLVLLIFKSTSLKPTVSNSVWSGSLSGFFAGLFGTGGAIRGVALSAFNLKTEVFIATSAIIDLAVDLSRSIVYSFNDYADKKDLYLIPILLVVSIVGTLVGKQLLSKISEEHFKTIVLVLVLATGGIMLSRLIIATP